MTCANCARTVERTLQKTPGVENASVNYASEQAQVTFDPKQVKPAELIERVRKAGYDVALAHADLPILGMTCANCASTVERTLRKLPGVNSASVNYASERANIDYVPSSTSIADMVGAVRKAGYDVPSAGASAAGHPPATDVEAAREAALQDRKRRMIIGLAFALPAFALSMSRDFGLLGVLFGPDFAPMSPAMMAMRHAPPLAQTLINWGVFALTLPVMVITARPFFVHGYKAVRNGAANMDVLVALGSGVAFVYSVLTLFGVFKGHVYFETAAMIVALISIGKYLEARAKGRTGAAIQRLMGLAPKTARVVRQTAGDTCEIEIPINQINIGDVVVVRPGERIATDGIVIAGHSAVDESMITGESMPRDKKPGGSVIGGTVNKEGLLKFEASKVGRDTMLANIVRLVEQAQGSKAPIQGLADRISAWFVPAILAIATLTFIGWLVIAHAPLETALINAISVLVIACPCALGLATPTAIMVGMGKGAESGILFRSSAALERASELTTMVLDKTGTITQGKPAVTDVIEIADPVCAHSPALPSPIPDARSARYSPLLQLAASAEAGSEHPLAQAIVAHAKTQGVPLLPVQHFLAVPGKGVTAGASGNQVSVGNLALMQQQGIALDEAALQRISSLQHEGKTTMFVALDGVLAGLIALRDWIKPGSAEAIAALRQRGVRVIMLTGDNVQSAQRVAREAGVDDVIADVLPGDKAQVVQQLQSSGAGGPGNIVGMVGDGINDAPALAQADVGIALGTGTDVAMEAADVTLISGDLRKVPEAMALSRLIVRGIRQNLFWAFIYNIVLVPTAIAGVFSQYGPVIAAGAMAFSSLFVVGNSLWLRTRRVR